MALSFPFGKAASNITLNAGRCLVAFLISSSERFRMLAETGTGTSFNRSLGGQRLSRDMAVHRFHGIEGSEGKATGQRFVKRDR